MSFDGKSQSGHTIHFDGTAEHAAGPSPMEAVLVALCGCTSMDVVSILQKKREPLEGLARDGQLGAFVHDGFWHPMDTLRDKHYLDELWATGRAPWKTWS